MVLNLTYQIEPYFEIGPLQRYQVKVHEKRSLATLGTTLVQISQMIEARQSSK